jgi:holo-[acyl-carrier protein] synthase
VEVRHKPGGAPIVALRGGAREVFERSGIAHMHLSISHCRSHATAYAIAEADPVDE